MLNYFYEPYIETLINIIASQLRLMQFC